jgi:hypothetical protein
VSLYAAIAEKHDELAEQRFVDGQAAGAAMEVERARRAVHRADAQVTVASTGSPDAWSAAMGALDKSVEHLADRIAVAREWGLV